MVLVEVHSQTICATNQWSVPRMSVYTAMHGMQTRSRDENSVCLSVPLSDKRVHCDKTEKRSVQIFIPYERSFSLVF